MKKFIPNSIPIWSIRIFFLLFSITILVCSISLFIVDYITLLWFIIFTIFSIVLIYDSLTWFSYKICLFDEKIYTKCHLTLFKSDRIQYKTLINYADIEDVKIISSTRNSKNQVLHINLIASPISKFLEFKTKSGKLKRIWINFFTKKQIERLLNALIDRIKSVNPETQLSVEKIMEDWYAYPKNAKNIKN